MDKQYRIALFDKKIHHAKDFTSGVEALDSYLKQRASQEVEKKITAVYILHRNDASTIIGYYTLSSYSFALADLPENIAKKLPRYQALPVTLLGRLAVDKRWQKKGIGEHLLLDALYRSYQLSKQLGSFAVVVDAKDKQTKAFYEHYGFRESRTRHVTLYLPMGTIKQLLA